MLWCQYPNIPTHERKEIVPFEKIFIPKACLLLPMLQKRFCPCRWKSLTLIKHFLSSQPFFYNAQQFLCLSFNCLTDPQYLGAFLEVQ